MRWTPRMIGTMDGERGRDGRGRLPASAGGPVGCRKHPSRDSRYPRQPRGKPLRKRYEDAVQRHEMLVVTRFDPRERTEVIAGFVEWHTKVDGTITIRDAGTVGTEPQPGILRQLIRSLLHMFEPPSATVKVRADLPVWNTVFQQIPGFLPVGREYSRPYWRNIWEWTRENERAALRL